MIRIFLVLGVMYNVVASIYQGWSRYYFLAFVHLLIAAIIMAVYWSGSKIRPSTARIRRSPNQEFPYWRVVLGIVWDDFLHMDKNFREMIQDISQNQDECEGLCNLYYWWRKVLATLQWLGFWVLYLFLNKYLTIPINSPWGYRQMYTEIWVGEPYLATSLPSKPTFPRPWWHWLLEGVFRVASTASFFYLGSSLSQNPELNWMGWVISLVLVVWASNWLHTTFTRNFRAGDNFVVVSSPHFIMIFIKAFMIPWGISRKISGIKGPKLLEIIINPILFLTKWVLVIFLGMGFLLIPVILMLMFWQNSSIFDYEVVLYWIIIEVIYLSTVGYVIWFNSGMALDDRGSLMVATPSTNLFWIIFVGFDSSWQKAQVGEITSFADVTPRRLFGGLIQWVDLDPEVKFTETRKNLVVKYVPLKFYHQLVSYINERQSRGSKKI